MDVTVNHFAVLLAALSAMVVGMLWYSPPLFYRSWSRLAGVKMGAKQRQRTQIVRYALVFLASLLTAYILAHVAFVMNHFFQNSFLQDAVMSAVWLWLGFTVTRFYVHDAFEGRSVRLTALNGGHELVTLIVMACIIGFMGG